MNAILQKIDEYKALLDRKEELGIYIPGRFLTASSPFRTLIESPVYSLLTAI